MIGQGVELELAPLLSRNQVHGPFALHKPDRAHLEPVLSGCEPPVAKATRRVGCGHGPGAHEHHGRPFDRRAGHTTDELPDHTGRFLLAHCPPRSRKQRSDTQPERYPRLQTERRHFEKSTLGVCAAPGVSSSKYGRGPFPTTLAVNTCGKRRIYAL